MGRREDIRQKAMEDLQRFEVLMLDGHFDFGNGYHGQVYLNPHQLFRYPSTIWRFAQDLIELMPASIVEDADVVAGPVTGGALLAHTIAGLLDSRRALTQPARLFAPFAPNGERGFTLKSFYRDLVAGRRVLLADDVRNTGQTFERCAALVREAGGNLTDDAGRPWQLTSRCILASNGQPGVHQGLVETIRAAQSSMLYLMRLQT